MSPIEAALFRQDDRSAQIIEKKEAKMPKVGQILFDIRFYDQLSSLISPSKKRESNNHESDVINREI